MTNTSTPLIKLIAVATENKPKFGDECNSCGWCCMTETCSIGKELGAGDMLPCKFLTATKQCQLVSNGIIKADAIGSGTGCCAETQDERIARL